MGLIKNMEDEVRCGYHVSSARKRLWECELRIYEAFDKVCKCNNIEHFLIGGSAIGAIRHQGFIPWDDDIDIGMTRRNFNLFL